ncbi:MAG: hypothetical protein JW963_08640 [Anaerolineales bacterium]|nr:hypothetical protein [Anaerolineales bacterium]
MKRIEIVVWLIVTLFLAACQSLTQVSISTDTFLTGTPFHTSTSLLSDTPLPTATVLITPKITATPILATINTDDDLIRLIEQIYLLPCIGFNFAESPPPDVLHVSKLNFIEVDVQPDPNIYWISEIADNADGSRQAFVACEPEFCQDKLYIQDDKTEKVYEIDWESRMPWRPIQWVTWINNDILAFLQTSNPDHALLVAVNFDKREVLYEAVVFPDYYCATSTPTP